ncbi:hypothetical protein NDU88_002802 [Pleurodeles waltl]|uniref:Uncharacterized protein n=1 Tax=Pleurodeles waltl TaxID=8319 RepID=A0AAV7VBK8_PLEWA|nr:hypothetical protein NDU88_002802 [Pleurodeles waltl]
MDPDSFGEQVEISLVSLGEGEMVPKAHMPQNTSKYRQWVTIDGQKVEALRDTGVSMTTIKSQLVSTEQIVPNTFHQAIVADNRNDLEHTAWKEVELRSHLEMLGLPEWVCMTTRSMADREGSQGRLEPGTMAQRIAKKRGKGHGKPVPEVPAVVDRVSEEEAPEPTGEDIATLGDLPELAGWQVEGGPTREEFCKAQKEWPTLEGMRKQASAQEAEVPQKEVGFSPFEFLYGYPVRGALSIVKEGLEKAPKAPPQDVVSYMLALRNQMTRFWKEAKSNLEASQEVMKRWYDQKATLVEFQPGDKVWVMEPVEPRALQDRWSGPFEVKERKGEATYLVDLQTPRNPLRVLHVNRQKPHFERSEIIMLLVTDEGMEEESEPLPDLLSAKEGDGSVKGVILSDSLTLNQRGDCYELLEEFCPLFSLTPGLTHLCVHDIDTGDSLPVKNKIYRLSDKVKASIKEEVSKMLALRVIEKSSSPWASPVVLVPKSTAKVRSQNSGSVWTTGVSTPSHGLILNPSPELMSSLTDWALPSS